MPGDDFCFELPKEEKWKLALQPCWVPDCPNLASVKDGAGWHWCFDHVSHAGSYVVFPINRKKLIKRIEELLAS